MPSGGQIPKVCFSYPEMGKLLKTILKALL
jgi:hypothetical protein